VVIFGKNVVVLQENSDVVLQENEIKVIWNDMGTIYNIIPKDGT